MLTQKLYFHKRLLGTLFFINATQAMNSERPLVLENVNSAIKNLATTNNTDSSAIIPDVQPIKQYVTQLTIGRFNCDFFEACMRDTAALNWFVHATKGNIPIFGIEDISFTILHNKKYVPINQQTDTTQSNVVRINGKSYREDQENGTDTTAMQEFNGYTQRAFQPQIYPDLIDHNIVSKDRNRIEAYLLCLKAKKGFLKMPPKPINHAILLKNCLLSGYLKDYLQCIPDNIVSGHRKKGFTHITIDNFYKKLCSYYLKAADEIIEKLSFKDVQNIIAYHFPPKKVN